VGNFVAVVIDDGGINAKEGERGSARLAVRRPRKRGDHVRPGLGLPPGIDDGAAFVADMFVEPDPGFGIDRLYDGAEQPE
jgi:hypothetical protein